MPWRYDSNWDGKVAPSIGLPDAFRTSSPGALVCRDSLQRGGYFPGKALSDVFSPVWFARHPLSISRVKLQYASGGSASQIILATRSDNPEPSMQRGSQRSFPSTYPLFICTVCVPEVRDYIGRDNCLSKENRTPAIDAGSSPVSS